MARKLKSDRILFTTTILLLAVSVVMVYSASAALAFERYGRASTFLVKQGLWTLLGLAMLFVVMRIDYRTYREPVFIWSGLGLVVVCLVLVLFSPPVNSARRWFGVGSLGIQPSELAKLVGDLLHRGAPRAADAPHQRARLLAAADRSGRRRARRSDPARARLRHVDVARARRRRHGLRGRPQLLVHPRGVSRRAAGRSRQSRWARRTAGSGGLPSSNPWEDPLGAGFQIIQSLIAVGTGGVWGKGLMNGVQKLFYLPEPHTDFIYAVISEEVGLVGATLVLACFCVVAWRGLRDCAPRARQLRLVSRARPDDDDRAAGVRQHQRRAGSDADEGNSAAVRELGRVVAADQSAWAWACSLNVSQHTSPEA